MPKFDTEGPSLPPELILGVPVIDGEHDRLFFIHSLLSDCQSGSSDTDVIKTAALLLRDYASQHLTHEEMMLRANHYPELDEHIRQHEELRRDLAKMAGGVQTGTTSLDQLKTFVWNWLSLHIGQSDRAYAEYFAGRELEIPPMSIEAMLSACGDDDESLM